MTILYSEARAQKTGRLARASLYSACALLALALTICVILCTRVNTGNAEKLLYTVIGLFTLAGWIAILLFRLVYLPSAAGYRHMKSVLSGEEEELEGRLTRTPALFQIPKGILVRKVTLAGETEDRALNVDARFVHQLPPDGTRVRLRTVRKFITAFEVLP